MTVQVRFEDGDDLRAVEMAAEVVKSELASRNYPIGTTPEARELRVEIVGPTWKVFV